MRNPPTLQRSSSSGATELTELGSTKATNGIIVEISKIDVNQHVYYIYIRIERDIINYHVFLMGLGSLRSCKSTRCRREQKTLFSRTYAHWIVGHPRDKCSKSKNPNWMNSVSLPVCQVSTKYVHVCIIYIYTHIVSHI